MKEKSKRESCGLARWMRLVLLLRSVLVGATWSPKRMQALGFLYTVLPLLREPRRTGRAWGDTVKEHMGFFNTNPVMSGFVFGLLAREIHMGEGGSEAGVRLGKLKWRMSGMLGALGDYFFLDGFLPALGLVSVVLGLTCGFVGVLVFLCVYNVTVLALRWEGLAESCTRGLGVVKVIRSDGWRVWASAFGLVGALCCGFAAAAGFGRVVETGGWMPAVFGGAVFAVGAWGIAAVRPARPYLGFAIPLLALFGERLLG